MGRRYICLATVNSAGGALISSKQNFVSNNGHNVIVLGDKVTPHVGLPPHPSPANEMVTAVDWITIDGHPVCFEGDQAACGHQADGSPCAYIDD